MDFQGTKIAEGKGHNKQESKRDAATNALGVVAPKIYKELFGEVYVPKDKKSA